MNSMTGFGTARTKSGAVGITVEASSINKKGLEIHLNLPDALAVVDADIRKMIQNRFARGRFQISVKFGQIHPEKQLMERIDPTVIKEYHALFSKLSKSLGHAEPPSLTYLLTLPGAMKESSQLPATELGKVSLDCVEKALDHLEVARKREGTFLCKEMLFQVAVLDKRRLIIEKAAPGVVEYHREALRKRIKDAGIALDLNDDRLLKEVALFADRSDISEELTRLKAHLQEAVRLLKSEESAGRKFDFLIQEINREINTIGSKCSAYQISKEVIEFKAEVERIREQVQNLE